MSKIALTPNASGDGVFTITAPNSGTNRAIALPDAAGTIPLLAAASNTAITSTPAELNILDGVTSTAAELNILDGVTSTTAELNILDGVTSTAAELNILDGVTATAAEINLIDGGTARGTTAVADGDGFLTNDGGTMRMTSVDTLATYIGTKVEVSDSSSATTLNAATTAFTGIPAAVRTVRIVLDNVKTGNYGITVKLGDSGGIEGSGYVGLGHRSNSTTVSKQTAYWPLFMDDNGAYGFMDITRVATGSNRWIQSGQALIYGSSGAISNFSGGSKTLSGELTQLQIGGGNGNNVTGNVTIVWGY